MKNILSGNHDKFLLNVASITLTFKKISLILSSFNLCPSLPSVATDDRKQFNVFEYCP